MLGLIVSKYVQESMKGVVDFSGECNNTKMKSYSENNYKFHITIEKLLIFIVFSNFGLLH